MSLDIVAKLLGDTEAVSTFREIRTMLIASGFTESEMLEMYAAAANKAQLILIRRELNKVKEKKC